MALARQIASNAAIATAARIFGGIFGLAATALIARMLKPDGFGEYAAILAFLYIFQALADLGLYSTLVREISKPGSNEIETVNHLFTMRLAALAALLSLGVVAILFVPQYTSSMKTAAPLIALFYFFLSSSQVLMGVFQKRLAIIFPATAEILSRIFQLGLVWLLFFLEAGLVAVAAAVMISTGLHFSLTIIFARRLVPFRLAFSLKRWQELFAIAFPIGISLVFTLLYFRADTVLLSLLKPARDVGIYNLAYKVLENVIFYPAMLVGLLMPLLSHTASRDIARFRAIFQKSFEVLLLIAVPLVIGGFFLAEPIILLLGGSRDFLAAVLPLRILLVATGFIFFGSLFGNSVIALDRQRPAMVVYFMGMIFNVMANLVFIPRFSYLAAATTTVFTELFITTGLLFLVAQKTQTLPSLLLLPRILLASGIMAALIAISTEPLYVFLGPFALVPLILGGAALYFGVLFLLGGIKRKDMLLFFGRI